MAIEAQPVAMKCAVLLLVLFMASVIKQANAQGHIERDVSGTTWDCRADSHKAEAVGSSSEFRQADSLRITLNPGGSTSSRQSDGAAQLDDDGPLDWFAGEWHQDGSTVRLVSNGTVESFRGQPRKDGDSEKMLALKISGDQMKGQLFDHSGGKPAAVLCRRVAASSDEGLSVGGPLQLSSLPAAGSSNIDVRFNSAPSRLLNDSEMAVLRDSLHWEPDAVPLSRGGTATSYLLDHEGRRLGSMGIQWAKTSAQKGVPATGSFTLQLENGSSCGFLGEAELDDPKGNVVVSNLELDSWVGLHQPAPGQTTRAEGDAELPNPNAALVFKPLAVSSSLSACTTPENPPD